LRPIPFPFDWVVWVAMLVLLVLIAAGLRVRALTTVFALLAVVYSLFDQQRWQPWFYQYVVMLVAIAFGKVDACRFIVASIYFWSGVQKLNPGFTEHTFQWMMEPFGGSWPVGLAYGAAITESAIGVGLMIAAWRNLAVVLAIAMHVFILASIGPWGHNHNRVVWPWNLVMAALVILLFWRNSNVTIRNLVKGGYVVVALFGVMPALSLIGLWDSYLSFSLYSGNQNKATIYMDDTVAGKLPEAVQQVVSVYNSDFPVDALDLEDWSYDELNVPPYAELRVIRNVGRQVCRDTGNSPLMVMIVEPRRLWFQQRHSIQYTCAALSK